MRRPSPLLIACVAGALGAVGLWLAGVSRVVLAPPERAPAVGGLTVTLPDGERIEVADLRGRVVLLNLLAGWCGPCRVEAPRLARLYREMAADGLVVLGLDAEGAPLERLDELRRAWGLPYPVGRPGRRLARPPFGPVPAIPHTWLIDRSGRIRASLSGVIPERALRRAVRRLLDDPMVAGRSVGRRPHADTTPGCVRTPGLALALECPDSRGP